MTIAVSWVTRKIETPKDPVKIGFKWQRERERERGRKRGSWCALKPSSRSCGDLFYLNPQEETHTWKFRDRHLARYTLAILLEKRSLAINDQVDWIHRTRMRSEKAFLFNSPKDAKNTPESFPPKKVAILSSSSRLTLFQSKEEPKSIE